MSMRSRTRTRSKRNEWEDVEDVGDVQNFRTFVLYGRSGTGKTTLAATFPHPALLLDVRDKGTDSISDVKGVSVKRIESHNDMEDIYWRLKDDPERFKTIIIDTISQWQELVIEELMAGRKTKGRPGDWGTMTKRDWGTVAAKLKEWIINYRDLADDDIEVVFIAQDRAFNFHDDENEDDMQLAPEIGPQLMPSVVKVLNAGVTMIGNTFTRERSVTREVRGRKKTERKIEFCLRVGPNPIYVTKVRKPRSIEAPSAIVDPTYQDIMSIIKGE